METEVFFPGLCTLYSAKLKKTPHKKHICKEKLSSYTILILYSYYKQMCARKEIGKKLYIIYQVRSLLCDFEVTSLHTFSPNSPILLATPICYLTIL
jgi:hypothetical protein